MRKIAYLLVLFLALGTAAAFAAGEGAELSTRDEPVTEGMTEYKDKRENLVPVKKLLKWDVYTESGDEVGEIVDIVLDPGTGLAAFAAVGNGEIEDELAAVPMNVMTMKPYPESFVIPDDMYAADATGGYMPDKKGRYSYEQAKDIYSAHGMRDYIGVLRDIVKEDRPNLTPLTAGLIGASKLTDMRVLNDQGAPAGFIDTLLLDPNTNMVTIALVRMEGPELKVETLKALPWVGLDIDTSGYKTNFVITDGALFEQTPVFDKDVADFTVDAARNIYHQYGSRYYQATVD
jgi:sporulation protein YlmC with PRC-barrel domain